MLLESLFSVMVTVPPLLAVAVPLDEHRIQVVLERTVLQKIPHLRRSNTSGSAFGLQR